MRTLFQELFKIYQIYLGFIVPEDGHGYSLKALINSDEEYNPELKVFFSSLEYIV